MGVEGLVLPPLSPPWCPLYVAAWPHPVSESHRECGDPRPVPLRLNQGGGLTPVPWGSLCLMVWGGRAPSLFPCTLPERTTSRSWVLVAMGRGLPPAPSELHPSLTPALGGVRGCRGPSPGLHEGCFPTGFLFSWELLVVEGKGGTPLSPWMEPMHGPWAHLCPPPHPGHHLPHCLLSAMGLTIEGSCCVLLLCLCLAVGVFRGVPAPHTLCVVRGGGACCVLWGDTCSSGCPN